MTAIPVRGTDIFARTNADLDVPLERFADEAMTLPFDITGWTFRFVVRASPLSSAMLLERTIANGGVVVTDAALGKFAIRADKAALASMLPADQAKLEGVYDLQASSGAGVDEVWLAGRFFLDLGIAR